MRIKKYHKIILCSICATLLGVIIGIGITILSTLVNSEHSNESNMITLLSIIVTLGVAYSFYSIYRVTDEFFNLKRKTNFIQKELKAKTETLQNDIKAQHDTFENEIKNQSELSSKQSYALDRKMVLHRKDLWAAKNYENRRFLQALKNEIETLLYVLENEEYLNGKLLKSDNEVESSIGVKRSLIANDIYTCVKTLTLEKISKFKENEYEDSKKAIKKAIMLIRNTDSLWTLIHKNEQERYVFLFDLIFEFFRETDLKRIPFNLQDEDVYKLIFYSEGVYVGSQTDEELGYHEWKRRYQSKSSGEIFL